MVYEAHKDLISLSVYSQGITAPNSSYLSPIENRNKVNSNCQCKFIYSINKANIRLHLNLRCIQVEKYIEVFKLQSVT